MPAAERDDDGAGPGSLAPQVAVHDDGRHAGRWRSRAASSSAIATQRCLPPVQPTAMRHVALALALVAAAMTGAAARVRVEELARAVLAEHVVAHRRRRPGQRPQLGHPVRVGQEAQSTTRSASTGRPYLKPKDITVARSARAVLAAERGVDLAAAARAR